MLSQSEKKRFGEEVVEEDIEVGSPLRLQPWNASGLSINILLL